MSYSAQVIDFKGKDVIELVAGKYRVVVAPFLGSNVIRMEDTEAGLDILRHDDKLTIDEMIARAEIYGMPTLYLPNRLAHGKLKTSDCTYHLPINETELDNHLHGFLHQCAYDIVSYEVVDNKAIAKTQYIYDSKHTFYQYFPVDFKAEMTLTLSDEGLNYEFTMTNLSNYQLPYGVCNHTAFNGPFTEDGDGLNVRLYLPIGDKWALDKNCIPNGEFLPITNHERQYLTGSQVPVLHVIDNDVFYAEEGEYKDKPFYGAIVSDEATNHKILYEVCKDYKFWIVWNDGGNKGYFCPEPSTWIINAPNLPIPANETGYIELAPGESKTISSRIYTE